MASAYLFADQLHFHSHKNEAENYSSKTFGIGRCTQRNGKA
jgi:hypothetical protein